MLLSFPCFEATLSRYEVAKIMFLIMRKSELDFQMNKIDILASLARLFPRVYWKQDSNPLSHIHRKIQINSFDLSISQSHVDQNNMYCPILKCPKGILGIFFV